MITLCPGSRQYPWWHTFPNRCVASNFPSPVSPPLHMQISSLPSSPLHFSLSHSIKVFAPFLLPEAVALGALTCVSSRVRSAIQSVHTLRRPLTPSCWLVFLFFMNILLSSRGLWSRIWAVFMPLYAVLAEGTLHFKIHIQIGCIILISPSPVGTPRHSQWPGI